MTRAADLAEARAATVHSNVVIAFIDLNIGRDSGGLELLEDGTLDSIEAIYMSETDNPLQADEAAKKGASYFFCKPFNAELLGPLLQDIVEEATPEPEPESVGQPCTIDQFGFLRGSSRAMRKLYRVLRKVSQVDASLMIVGESGTGKELVAQTAHTLSPRSSGPFVAFNCAAVVENLAESELFGHEKGSFSGARSRHRGLFERAHGGTLFLDEITEMDINLQAKLLRVLETRTLRRIGGEETIEIDVRFISATNRSPEQAVQEGKLREDLYFRLAQFPLRVPPLRQREDDIGGLAHYFLNSLNDMHQTDISITSDAIASIAGRPWPGNVRELKNYIEKAYILSESVIDVPDLEEANVSLQDIKPPADRGEQISVSVGTPLADAEKELILASLQRHDGDKKKSAAELGISLKTLYNRLRDYEEDAVDSPPSGQQKL